MIVDAYLWVVEYDDGSWHGEYDPTAPEGRGWAEIDLHRVKTIALANPLASRFLHRVTVPSDTEPVFFRRRQIALADGQEQGRSTIHCVGWKRGEEGVYLFVFEDGSVLLSTNFQAV